MTEAGPAFEPGPYIVQVVVRRRQSAGGGPAFADWTELRCCARVDDKDGCRAEDQQWGCT
jgi:hypothetical protein